MVSRASPAFQAGKILGGNPERCSGPALQKTMVASAKRTVPAPPSPTGRRRWSRDIFSPGLKASVRALPPFAEDYFSSVCASPRPC